MDCATVPKARSALSVVQTLSFREHGQSRVAHFLPFCLEHAFVLYPAKKVFSTDLVPIILAAPTLGILYSVACGSLKLFTSTSNQTSAREKCIHHAVLLCDGVLGSILFCPLAIKCRSRSAIGRYGAFVHLHSRPSARKLRQLQTQPPNCIP